MDGIKNDIPGHFKKIDSKLIMMLRRWNFLKMKFRAGWIHLIWVMSHICQQLSSLFGPSGVRALPLAAGINVGGHYFGPSVLRAPAEQTKVATILGTFFHFLSYLILLPPLFKTTEGVVVLFQIFAWAPKKK